MKRDMVVVEIIAEEPSAKGIPSTTVEVGVDGISSNGVVALIRNAPEAAHDRSDHQIGEPNAAFVPMLAEQKHLNRRVRTHGFEHGNTPAFHNSFLVLQETHLRKQEMVDSIAGPQQSTLGINYPWMFLTYGSVSDREC